MMEVRHGFDLQRQRQNKNIQRDREFVQIYRLHRLSILQAGNDLTCKHNCEVSSGTKLTV